ncbi:MAG: 3-hydroxyacyl-CoA dehydrogenase family protein [bacterium]|nr:3-hydroxyacyl-CoA dehydrogenase family protein [candidate division KSB1 bacterium]MDH7559215.1 3-hydroxyacyl-CoA dehydrogenase family protein [bacterium]
MTLDERLQNVAVIGAAGKMGTGIVALLAVEMAKLRAKRENRHKVYQLHCIDVNEAALDALRAYVKTQATKAAEKSIVALRDLYADREDLVENSEVVAEFADTALGILWPGTELAAARRAHMVFEAVIEDTATKVGLLRSLRDLCPEDTFFFTNTSSIPIGLLDWEAGLSGRLIGYHFYNPPVVQRLVEVICPANIAPELRELAYELGARLGKKLFPANDIAGFIGNGHFSRDGLYACQEAQRLAAEYSLAGGVYLMNKVSQDLLLRPMVIFQLIDYVGVDVFYFLLKVMDEHIEGEELHSELIDRFYQLGIVGGQRSDGSQKDGILKYEKGRPVAIYDLEKREYRAFDPKGWTSELDAKLGPYPEGYKPWKELLAAPNREEYLRHFFATLFASGTLGAQLAEKYLRHSKAVGQMLVSTGVASCADDVNGVLVNGFYHLYGPINDFV